MLLCFSPGQIRGASVLIAFSLFILKLHAVDYYVAKNGDDDAAGSAERPFMTISEAASIAQPGDTITVREGIYREWVNPVRGGESDDMRIVYQAAPGAEVIIKGSEPVTGWKAMSEHVWLLELPNSYFGDFNPYAELVQGAWFWRKEQDCHLGAVYLDGHWLLEAPSKDSVMAPMEGEALWFSEVNDTTTRIWAQFAEVNPNEANVEINVRKVVFYPESTGINYITVRGFTLEQAAPPWAPPTAEQFAIIGTNWSKGWLIEDNTIRYSACSGVSLGKYGDEYDNTHNYNHTIRKALQDGWSKETIGHHVVRNNHIYHCEQAGILGSLGSAFCTIEGNEIHDIHVRRIYSGCEMAGIKFHAPIDSLIRNNRIYRTPRALWLDWMTQGTRVTGNLFHDNAAKDVTWTENWGANAPDGEQDLFLEVNHGPTMIDNNLFLSPYTLNMRSQGVVFAHNLFAGAFKIVSYDERQTPYHFAHSTEMVTTHDNPGGDSHYFNNIFVGTGDLRGYDVCELPSTMKGNVFVGGATPAALETNPLVQAEVDPQLELIEKEDGVYLQIRFDAAWGSVQGPIVTSEKLPDAIISGLRYENSDGTPFRLTEDLFGAERRKRFPYPGPFAQMEPGTQLIKVWPRD